MTQTLATLPSSQRAPFSRLQASIRSAYHRSVNARKNAEFRAHLSATTPGGSLLAHARADPRGKMAQKGLVLQLLLQVHIPLCFKFQSVMNDYPALYVHGVTLACLVPPPSSKGRFSLSRYAVFVPSTLRSLWGIMRLQIIPENLGGAGKQRLEWEIDDAVFKESG